MQTFTHEQYIQAVRDIAVQRLSPEERMRRAGRSKWSRADFNAAAREFERLAKLIDAAAGLTQIGTTADGGVVVGPQGWKNLQAARGAAIEPRFMLVWEPDRVQLPGEFYTLSEMLEANRDDAELCAWLLRAEPGQFFQSGGGAAPACTTWRVS